MELTTGFLKFKLESFSKTEMIVSNLDSIYFALNVLLQLKDIIIISAICVSQNSMQDFAYSGNGQSFVLVTEIEKNHSL